MNEVMPERPRWDLAAESIVVKIRWFGVIMGYVLVQTRTGLHNPSAVRDVPCPRCGLRGPRLGVLEDGRGFPQTLAAVRLVHGVGLHRPSVLSRYRARQSVSLVLPAFLDLLRDPLPTGGGLVDSGIPFDQPAEPGLVLGFSTPTGSAWPLTLVIMAWVTWASSSLAGLLKAAGDQLQDLNSELVRVRAELEERVDERTDALRTSQARMIQQEKMAAFGLLAAGIAHEVGNPLAALSSLVQILKRRGPDPYTSEKLDLAGRQLHRIERTIRELIDFSRPASRAITRTRVCEVVDEALGIAKYYQRTKQRRISTDIPTNLPSVLVVRDYLTQVVLNLVLNAIDATDDQGRIHLPAQDRRRLDGAERRGRRPGDLAGRPLPAFSAVLHDQAARHRAGTFRQPPDPRGVLCNADLLLRAGTGLDVHDPASLGSCLDLDSDRSERRGSRRSGSRLPPTGSRSGPAAAIPLPPCRRRQA